MPPPRSKAEQFVQHRLRELGFEVKAAKYIRGFEPDFVATTPDGRTVVVEVKGWLADEGHFARARSQLELYKSALGADAGIIVMASLLHAKPDEGIFGMADLERLVIPSVPAERAHRPQVPNPQRSVRRVVFAAMPFAPQFDDVFFVAMTHAADAVGAVCKRIDLEDYDGDVVQGIKKLIDDSAAVIADLSGARPNVLFELGYAQGRGKPCAHICSSPLDEMPFDVRNWSVLRYETGRTSALRSRLENRLRAIIDPA